jgi:hypothetical protein
MSKIRFPCGNCSYLSCNEAQQQEAKNEGIDMNHYCKKYNKRLFYYTYSIYYSPEIYACEECNNQTYNTYNKLDKYIREKFRRSMEDDSAFKINYPSAEKFLEIVKMMKKESNLIGKRSMTFYESDFYRERLEAVSNRIKLDIEEAIENDKSLKPIPNKAAKTKDSIYETFIYDGGN